MIHLHFDKKPGMAVWDRNEGMSGWDGGEPVKRLQERYK